MARCRFVEPTSKRIPLSDDDWIEIKRELNSGEQRRVFSGMVVDYHAGEPARLNPERVGVTRVLGYLLDWSFPDKSGHIPEVSLSTLDALDTDSYNEIEAAIDAHHAEIEQERAARKNTTGGTPISAAISPSVD